jgi:hypothetical protein
VCKVNLAAKNDMMKNDLESDKAECSMTDGSLRSVIAHILAVVPVWAFSTHNSIVSNFSEFFFPK